MALCGRGVGRIIDQPIIDLTVLCLHPLASTLIRKGWKEPRTLVEEALHYSLRGRCYAEETLRLCLGWIVQCMKHAEEQFLSILHRTIATWCAYPSCTTCLLEKLRRARSLAISSLQKPRTFNEGLTLGPCQTFPGSRLAGPLNFGVMEGLAGFVCLADRSIVS